MATFNVETLNEALERLGRLDNRDFILIVWTGVTEKCKPIARAVRLVLPQSISDDIGRDIMQGVNSKVWILTIIDEHKNIYMIQEAKKFAMKDCGKNGKKVKEET